MIVLGNVSGLLNLILFVFLLTFLASIFATQLFRGELPYASEDGETIRVSFNTLYNSFLGMYQILSSENWTTILYNVTTYEKAFNTAWIGAAFCILWFIFGNCEYPNRILCMISGLTNLSHCPEYVYCCYPRKFRRFGRREAITAS
jgi:hypothetical protein